MILVLPLIPVSMRQSFALLLAFAIAPSFLSAAEPVRFESFSYTGRDEIYNAPLNQGEFRNPILAGYYPDPSICRVDGDYYLINSTFAHFPGIPIFHSTDLVNWTQIGNAISRPTQLPYEGLGLTRGLFAPAISHHDGVFYIVCTLIDAGGNFVITATDPAGPWSDPIWLNFDGIDPSLFFDESTGRAWILNNGEPPDNKPLYSGHRAIWIQEWDIPSKRPKGPRKIIINGGVDLDKKPVWIEGPHIYKRGDWYYLNCAEGGTSVNHSQVIFRSRQPDGPYTPHQVPTLTQRDLPDDRIHPVTCTGHADFEIGPDGNWWAVFLGCTPYSDHHYNTGRQTFLLPVTWSEDDWPQILPPGEAVPFVVKAPASARLRENPSMPLTGNFTWRDEFDRDELGNPWLFMRAPRETWWSLKDDALFLTPRSEPMRGRLNPSFVGRRLQHNRFTAETTLHLPEATGVSAGLSAFHNESHHYNFGVRRRDKDGSSYVVYVETQQGREDQAQLTTAGLAAAPGSEIVLRLTGHDADYLFEYSVDQGTNWTRVGGTFDARNLSVETSYDFIGVLLGLYARTL